MEDIGRLIAGAMSGTSADGVDVAIVRITGRGVGMGAKLVQHHHRDYDAGLKGRIFGLRGDGAVRLEELAKIGREISLTYAAAVNEALSAAGISARDLAAVAAHGQTLFHDPPNTIQWFDPALVAAEVGCPVVSDFRRADCAAGGQGAPLVPFADYVLFRDEKKNRVLLNIGGIANITYLKAGGRFDEVIAFDTGPGNCVSDYLAREAGLPDGMDRDGKLAQTGTADFQVASAAIRNWKDVFRKPPRSADTPEMIAAYKRALGDLHKEGMSLADQMATACMMCALGIQMGGLDHLASRPDEVIASGGGTENPVMMRQISEILKLKVVRLDELGVPSDAKEAIAFGLLGAATLDGVPSNVPSVTGARRAVVLGSVTPRP